MLLRIRKFLRTRFFIGAAILAVEFALIMTLFLRLYAFFLPFTFLAWFLQISVFLYLVNKDGIPELKIPWLITVMAIPVAGVFLYLLLSSSNAGKKECARYHAAREKTSILLGEGSALDSVREECPQAYSQAMFLKNTAGAPALSYKSVKYYDTGEKFHEDLLKDLEAAKEFILLEYFIIARGKMWDSIHEAIRRKAEAGVKVYVMYDDFGCFSTLPSDYAETLTAEGIIARPANRFRPVLSHIHNNRDHRKIAVIDGFIGYTGGINLADEYINAVVRFGNWKDTAVRIEGEAAKKFTALFIEGWNMQGGVEKAPMEFMRRYEGEKSEKGLAVPFGDSPAPIDIRDTAKNVYLNMINLATKYVYITTPYLICDHELMAALSRAAQRGVDVRMITPHIPDKKIVFLLTRSNYKQLTQSGVKIYEYTPGFIHAKNFAADDRFAVCGTINLDYRSLVHHFECGVWMYDTDAVRDIRDDFLNTQAVSEQIENEKAALTVFQRIVAQFVKVFSPMM